MEEDATLKRNQTKSVCRLNPPSSGVSTALHTYTHTHRHTRVLVSPCTCVCVCVCVGAPRVWRPLGLLRSSQISAPSTPLPHVIHVAVAVSCCCCCGDCCPLRASSLPPPIRLSYVVFLFSVRSALRVILLLMCRFPFVWTRFYPSSSSFLKDAPLPSLFCMVFTLNLRCMCVGGGGAVFGLCL